MKPSPAFPGALAIALAFCVSGALSSPGYGQTLLDEQLKQVTFEQKLGQKVSLDLPFLDEEGRSVTLAQYFHHGPVILVPGYYGCPMLCQAMANGLVNTLRDLPQIPGKDFTLVFFSINPKETPALAAEKKRSYLKSYAKHGTDEGWRFLTGSEQSSRRLADEIGFRYFYDAVSKQWAHPGGIVVLTPDGQISHYAFGVNFTDSGLTKSLVEAGGGTIGTRLQQFILLCFHYQPVTGRYAGVAMLTLRAAAIALLLSLGTWIIGAIRRENGKSTTTPV